MRQNENFIGEDYGSESDDTVKADGLSSSIKKKKMANNLVKLNRLVVVGECLLGIHDLPDISQVQSMAFDSPQPRDN